MILDSVYYQKSPQEMGAGMIITMFFFTLIATILGVKALNPSKYKIEGNGEQTKFLHGASVILTSSEFFYSFVAIYIGIFLTVLFSSLVFYQQIFWMSFLYTFFFSVGFVEIVYLCIGFPKNATPSATGTATT